MISDNLQYYNITKEGGRRWTNDDVSIHSSRCYTGMHLQFVCNAGKNAQNFTAKATSLSDLSQQKTINNLNECS